MSTSGNSRNSIRRSQRRAGGFGVFWGGAAGSTGLSDRPSGEPDGSERGATVILSSGMGTSFNAEGACLAGVDAGRNRKDHINHIQ
jgi:hypothetical protein